MIDPKDCCVVSVGVGGWYPRGIDRLEESLKRHSPEIPRLLWRDKLPSGSPPHEHNTYAFKYWAMAEAAEKYRYLLWLDASDWAVKPIEPLFEMIDDRQCLFCLDGWNCGQWTSDDALPLLGITREEAFTIPQLWSNHFGWDSTTATGIEIMREMRRFAKNRAFHGPRTNHHGEASFDPRVLGHRHDQTVLSVIAHRMNLPTIPISESPVQFVDRGLKKPGTLVYCQGM